VIRRIAPATSSRALTPTRSFPTRRARTPGGLGTSDDPQSSGGERWLVLLPGTQVASSDGQSFAGHHPVDAIMCATTWCGSTATWGGATNLVADSVRPPSRRSRGDVAARPRALSWAASLHFYAG